MEQVIGTIQNNKNLERINIMKKNTIIIAICLLSLMACSFAEGKNGTIIKNLRTQHKITQQKENAEFKASLAGKTKEERTALKAAHRATQQAENQEFKAQMEAKKAEMKAAKTQQETEQNTNQETEQNTNSDSSSETVSQ
jgi:hypothetical protein